MAAPDHNRQKKIALINDCSGFGRCSITVQLPVISAMHVQCCPLPTAVFSNHTGFPAYHCVDFTRHMRPCMDKWQQLGLRFDGICSGFLGSLEQIGIVREFLGAFKSEKARVLVDPVMGDYGKLYPTYTKAMCQEVRRLVRHADIITPNLTEACILAGVAYREHWRNEELAGLAGRLLDMGAGSVVITGIPRKSLLANLCVDGVTGRSVAVASHKIGMSRSGTGDVFSAILAADAVNGVALDTSVRKASSFIRRCIMKAVEMDLPLTDGVPFEELLGVLCRR